MQRMPDSLNAYVGNSTDRHNLVPYYQTFNWPVSAGWLSPTK